MATKKAFELKEGDTILLYGEKVAIKKIETSGKGLKQGRVKCRIEGETLSDRKPVTTIRLAEDLIELG